MLSNHMQKALPYLIFENKSSLLQSHTVHNNVIVLQEVVHSIRNKNSGLD